jgi:hypothetical protein
MGRERRMGVIGAGWDGGCVEEYQGGEDDAICRRSEWWALVMLKES